MPTDPSGRSRDPGEPRSAPEFAALPGRYVEELNREGFVDPERVLQEHPALGPTLLEDLETYVQLRSEEPSGTPLGTLGDYTLRRRIGSGGMGVVYEAWENSMDRAVALKVLHPGAAADDRTFHRFMREARTAGKLSHPNVVPVYAIGLKEHTPYCNNPKLPAAFRGGKPASRGGPAGGLAVEEPNFLPPNSARSAVTG